MCLARACLCARVRACVRAATAQSARSEEGEDGGTEEAEERRQRPSSFLLSSLARSLARGRRRPLPRPSLFLSLLFHRESSRCLYHCLSSNLASLEVDKDITFTVTLLGLSRLGVPAYPHLVCHGLMGIYYGIYDIEVSMKFGWYPVPLCLALCQSGGATMQNLVLRLPGR